VASDQPIVIVKKKARGHGGHHGGAWKVAYADFVTAMMAFFLVMWLVNQSKSVKAAIGGYFRDPGVFDQQHSNGAIPGGNGGLLPDGVPKTEQAAAEKDADSEKAAFERTANRIRNELEKGTDFQALKDQVEVSVTADGLRIQLLDSGKSSFFDTGSTSLKPETVKMLEVIARELSQLPEDVAIEGHTDNRPYSGNATNYGNWELSADRANAARRIMEPHLRANQLTAVRGFADREPRFPTDPGDPRNRRVSIVVRKPLPAGSSAAAGDSAAPAGTASPATSAAAPVQR
jgi:chemotaxis protein MotB